jgi:hypothetical protein
MSVVDRRLRSDLAENVVIPTYVRWEALVETFFCRAHEGAIQD